MSPIIIIPEEKETITLKTDNFKKYISNAYDSGYNEGYDKGKSETKPPTIGYRGFGESIPVSCDSTVKLLNKETKDELLRGK